MVVGILGFACWILGALIWVSGQSAIHEILAAIVILNGTILVATAHLASFLSPMWEKSEKDTSGMPPWAKPG